MAGILVKETDIVKLEKLGVKDSKLLTSEQREGLFERIKEIALDFRIKILEPKVIDAALQSSSLNLNWLEANTSAAIVNELKPEKVIVDCPSNNISAYQNYFMSKLGKELGGTEIVMEHKADLNHVVVGAASILAKVVRDREIEKLKKKFKVDLGTGYLTDEKTQKFLKENFNEDKYGEIFRKTWQPYRELVEWQGQKVLGDFNNFN